MQFAVNKHIACLGMKPSCSRLPAGYQCYLGRNANPGVATAHPRINEALSPRIWLRLFNSLDSIDSSNEHGVVEHMRSHVLVDRLIYARTGVLQAGEILSLVPQTAVVADVNHGMVE